MDGRVTGGLSHTDGAAQRIAEAARRAAEEARRAAAEAARRAAEQAARQASAGPGADALGQQILETHAGPVGEQEIKPLAAPGADELDEFAPPEAATYTVKAGDSLSAIAARHGGTWQELYGHGDNARTVGGSPDLIHPGQVLELPPQWAPAAPKAAAPKAPAPKAPEPPLPDGPVDLKALKADPALAEAIGRAALSDDPAKRTRATALLQGAVESAVLARVEGGARRPAAEVFAEIEDDYRAIIEVTGAAEAVHGVFKPAMEQAARSLVHYKAPGEPGVTLDEVRGNASIGKLLSTLQHTANGHADSELRGAVQLWTRELIAQSLEGKEGKAGVEEGLKRFHTSIEALVSQTGLGPVVGEAMTKELRVAERSLEAVEERGRSPLAEALDTLGDQRDATIYWLGGVAEAISEFDAVKVAGSVAEEGIGPKVPAYAGQIGGFTGVITDRLAPGMSFALAGEGGARIGAGAFAGGKLTGGAAITRNEDGTLTLAVQVGLEGEQGVTAETGASFLGPGATAEAAAFLGAGGGGTISMRFDPKRPADVERLQALLEPRNPALALNPLACAGFQDLTEALAHNLEAVEGTVQIKEGAEASVELDLEALGVNLGGQLEFTQAVGRRYNADGSTATSLSVKGLLKGGLTESIPGLKDLGPHAFGELDQIDTLTITHDARGNLTGISAETRSSSEDMGGVGSGIGVAGEVHRIVVKEQRALTAQGLAEARQLVAQGDSSLIAYLRVCERPGCALDTRSTETIDGYRINPKVEAWFTGAGGEVEAKAEMLVTRSGPSVPAPPDDKA